MIKKNKRELFLFFSLAFLLVLPFLLNIYLYRGVSGFVLESSIFGLDYHKFFHDFIGDKALFTSGIYSIAQIIYLSFYLPLNILGIFFSPINSYFLAISIFYVFSFYFLVKFLEALNNEEEKDKTAPLFNYLLSFLFLSSLSIFVYIKGSILSVLSILILPIQLYFIFSFLKNNNYKYLFYFLLLTFFNIFNPVYFFINFISVISLIIFLKLFYNFKIDKIIKKTLLILLSYLPSLILVFIVLFISPLYATDGGLIGAGPLAREDFYSLNTSYINILKQTSDWGFFGQWNGSLYYEFSKVYRSAWFSILAFIPYLLFLFLFILNLKNGAANSKKKIIFLLGLLLLLFQFMLGLKNPVYKYLYDNFPMFQVFRNITKFAPLLYLILIVILSLLISSFKNVRKYRIAVFAVLLMACFYNYPFWSYYSWFFESRTIIAIPSYFKETADYLNSNLSINDKILILPATYAFENYNLSGKTRFIQGNIFDVLLNNNIRSYRLSPLLIGDIFFQIDSAKLFKKVDYNPRGADVDYKLLSDFVRKYGLDYIVVTKDLVSEYQDMNVLLAWLDNNNYHKINSFGNNDIYLNNDIFRPILSFNNDISFERKNAKDFRIYIKNIKEGSHDSLVFLESFNKYWNLYLRPIPESHKGELSYLWEKPIFDDTHQLIDQDANSWIIDPEYIEQNFPGGYYKKNADGSIDVELTLYFKPQSYFYLGLIISGTALLGCLGYLAYGLVKRRPKRSSEKNNQRIPKHYES
jgi:hypothetical protein